MSRPFTPAHAAACELRKVMPGKIMSPADPGYAGARKLWNAADQRIATVAGGMPASGMVLGRALPDELMSASFPGGYANMPGPNDTEQIAAAYGPNTQNMLETKQKFDPSGVLSETKLLLQSNTSGIFRKEHHDERNARPKGRPAGRGAACPIRATRKWSVKRRNGYVVGTAFDMR